MRIRRPSEGPPGLESADGYIRFYCPCGRRLKVHAERPPEHGKCPDCGRIVPIPRSGVTRVGAQYETPTEELSSADHEALDRWASRFPGAAASPLEDKTPSVPTRPPSTSNPPPPKAEAGLRVCPRCRKPVHLGADMCRDCGIPVPRR